MENKPSEALNKILQGNFDNVKIDPDSIIIEGDRIRNDILMAIADQYRLEKAYTDKEIMNIILSLDEVVEKGLLTRELLDTIKKDPKILQDYISKLNKK